MHAITVPVTVLLGAPLLAAVLSLVTPHARLLHGINLTMTTGMA